MFVKICGITRPDDAIVAAAHGADAIGLNFVPTSRRYVELDTAREVLAVLPEHVLAVGVFWDHPAGEILGIVHELGLGAAQIHGTFTPEHADALAGEVELLITVATVEDLVSDLGHARLADVLMIDGPTPGAGRPIDWDRIGDVVDHHKVLLAGGLRPGNVQEAIRRVRPWGVDVASGVEFDAGRKDPEAVATFMAESRAV